MINTRATVLDGEMVEYVVHHHPSGLGLAVFTMVVKGDIIAEASADIKTIEAELVSIKNRNDRPDTLIVIGELAFKVEYLSRVLKDISFERIFTTIDKTKSALSLEDCVKIEDFANGINENLEREKVWHSLPDIKNTPEGIDYAIRQGRGATTAMRRSLGLSEEAFNMYRKEGMPENVFKQFMHILPGYF